MSGKATANESTVCIDNEDGWRGNGVRRTGELIVENYKVFADSADESCESRGSFRKVARGAGVN